MRSERGPNGNRRIFAHSFQPAASPKALTRISREIRSWALHHRSDKSLSELAQMYNPCIRGWIIYYGHFYRTQLRPTLKRIDAYVIRWARRKFKRMRVCQLCGVFLVLPYVATLENKALAAAAARQRLLDRSVSPEDAGQLA